MDYEGSILLSCHFKFVTKKQTRNRSPATPSFESLIYFIPLRCQRRNSRPDFQILHHLARNPQFPHAHYPLP